MNLDWLLAPVSKETFVGNHWGNTPLRIRRKDKSYYKELLPERALEMALHAASKTFGALEILSEDGKEGKSRSHSHSVAALRRGQSLRINAIQRFVNPIASLCSSLEGVLTCPVNVNMYLSPGSGKKALKRHYDTHDVFVLQIHGAKSWRLYDPAFPSPLEFLPLLRNETIEEMKTQRLKNDQSTRDQCVLVESFQMLSGDCLYLPRGVWHEAVSGENEYSCHLTIGLQPTTFLDVFGLAMSRTALLDVELRKSLPIGFSNNLSVMELVAAKATKILKTLPETLDLRKALGDMTSHLLGKYTSGLENDLLMKPPKITAGIVSLKSCLRVRRGLVLGLVFASDGVHLLFAGNVFAIDSAYCDACQFIAQHQSFKVSSLPGGISDEQRLVLARQLFDTGLLVPDEDTECASEVSVKLTHWLPVHIDTTDDSVEWIDLGTTSLSEPFLHQTISRYKKSNPKIKTVTTSTSTLVPVVGAVAPSGFIFHISRCGSTLVSNAMRGIAGTVVVSEPQPVNALLSALSNLSNSDGNEEISAGILEQKLVGLVEAYDRCRDSSDNALIIKFSSWNILHFATIRRLWPMVPCVAIVRDPVEVAVSCLERPPGWMKWKRMPDRLKDLIAEEDDLCYLTDEAFCARLLGTFLSVTGAEVDAYLMTIDYEEINLSKMREVAQWFGLNVSEEDISSMTATLSLYSKSALQRRPFLPDSKAKRDRATELVRSEIDRWARPAYTRIKRTLATTEDKLK